MEDVIVIERFAQLALAAAYLAGCIVAIVFWPKYPRPTTYLLIAAGLMFAVELVYVATWMLPDDHFDESNFFSYLNVADSFARLIAFVLLVLAVFAARDRRRPTDFDDDLL